MRSGALPFGVLVFGLSLFLGYTISPLLGLLSLALFGFLTWRIFRDE